MTDALTAVYEALGPIGVVLAVVAIAGTIVGLDWLIAWLERRDRRR